jgi:hypothetical protein
MVPATSPNGETTMAKIFRYNNGFKGTVSDEVAVILEKKGEGKIVGDAVAKPRAEAPKTEASK